MQPADSIGAYRIVRQIGQGGMGVVYEAFEERAHRAVALKVLSSFDAQNPQAVERFRREAAACAKLSHPGIVKIYEAGQVGRIHFIAMELIRGESLDSAIRSTWRPETGEDSSFHLDMDAARPGDASVLDPGSPASRTPAQLRPLVEIIRSAANALHAAHRAGILHRDVKPTNVLVTADLQAKVLDFGLARSQGARTLTRTGDLMGTPSYLSPEQIQGARVDARSDVYSLGVTLYQAVTNHLPFVADNISVLMQQILTSQPVHPRRWNPALPTDLETICRRAMHRTPTDRYITAHGLAHDLQRHLEGRPLADDYNLPTTTVVVRDTSKAAYGIVATVVGTTVTLASKVVRWCVGRHRRPPWEN